MELDKIQSIMVDDLRSW